MPYLNHLHLAHYFWEKFLSPTDWAIDATCGSGKDTEKLAELTPLGGVIALDIQEEALTRTKLKLKRPLLERVHFFRQSHEDFPALAYEKPISLIVYNLGYLPGSDKQITTLASTTLHSIQKGLELLKSHGILSIMCYPGHPEGLIEKNAILEFIATLDVKKTLTFHYQNVSKPLSPSLIIINKLK